MKVKIPPSHQSELRKHGHDKVGAKVKIVSDKSRETMAALCNNKAVDSEDAFDALFEVLASCSTRFGQSMGRRYASQSIIDTFHWLRMQSTPLSPTQRDRVRNAEIAVETAETERDEARAAYADLAHRVEQVLLQAETLVLSPDQKFFLGLENLLAPEHKAALEAYRKGKTRAAKTA